MCLADAGFGQTYALHKTRPAYVRARDLTPARDALLSYAGAIEASVEVTRRRGALARVEIRGPLETRAGYHDECGGWSDGYDAIADRMIEAFEDGDVLLVIDSPGGAVMGIVECVARILAAKAEFKRRVTVMVDSGMIASAAFWLGAAIADPGELHISLGSMAGSIGARSAHVSEAGALTQAGLVWTDFAYPAGKVALSPARALSAAGKARGERDVMAAFNDFQAAVTAARPALTRKAIIKLDADMLTGAAAVAAGLADSVATIEDVEAWALSRAGEPMEDEEKKAPAAEDMPPGEPVAAADEDKTEVCIKCEEALEPEDKFCSECGAEQTEEASEPSEPAATDDKPMPPPSGASVATMLGLRPGASDVATKTALASVLAEFNHVRKALCADSFGATRGKLSALAQDARQGVKAAQDLAKERAASEGRERVDLLLSLAKANLPGFPRGDLLVDECNARGDVIGMKAAKFYARTPLAELRGFVSGKLANAGPSERSPFEPSEANAKPGAKASAESTKLAARNGIAPETMQAADDFVNNALRGVPAQ
jgi:ClpP class serine protease